MKLPSFVEVYKCIALTAIAVLLGFILRSMPERPMTLDSVRAAKMGPGEWRRKVPLVYVGAGNVEVDNTVEVDVQNTVDVSGSVAIDR
jgi:hypothetical protein